MLEGDLDAADHICRTAFGTFLGLPDPSAFMGDAGYVRSRWLGHPDAAFVAEQDGELVGSNFVTNWGSVGFFGPLTVRPDMWDRGIAKHLLEPTMSLFQKWGTRHACLFTFAQSPKHIGLYQKYGFWPRFLIAIMSKEVRTTTSNPKWSKYSESTKHDEDLQQCRQLTDTVYQGLDLQWEIESIHKQGLGETVLLWNIEGKLDGLGVCHSGPGSEAGSGVCYIKFGVVRPGPDASQKFDDLLNACEAFARRKSVPRLDAGVNIGRSEAYRMMLAKGFRTTFQGVGMHRPDEPGYNRPNIFAIDDYR